MQELASSNPSTSMESGNMLGVWRTLNSEMILDQRWMRVRKDCVELPNGQCLDDYYLWIAGDVALVVPVTQDGKFVVVEQYKHAAGEIMKEFPAGMVDAGESPEEAARRELEEETNYIASQLYKLATLTDNPTKTVGNVHIYLAPNVKRRTRLLMDEQELKDYFHKMEVIGYKINVYGPERCFKFRGFADEALREMKRRKPEGYS